jgi:hypothetical protein
MLAMLAIKREKRENIFSTKQKKVLAMLAIKR